MKIECILQRSGGTHVELPGKTYHFAPQDDGKHVADVTIEAHIERFLSIPEAYRLLRAPGTEAAAIFAPQADALVPAPAVPVSLLGCPGYQPAYEIEGKRYGIEDIIGRAFKDSGLTAEDWNELPEDTRAIKLDLVLDGIADGEITDVPELGANQAQVTPAPETATAAPQSPAAEDRAALAAQYEAKFGKRPPNTMKIETIKAKLAE